MPLISRLEEDLKDAMRKRDALRRSVIRFMLSAIRYEQIEVQKALDDDGVIRVLTRQLQQHRESIEAFEKGGRQDLVDKEKAELAIVMEYLPQQMSRDEIMSVVRQAIEDVGARGSQDRGKVMGRVMPQVRGRAEGREVNAIVSELLKGVSG